jgi:hypothetical protein
MPANGDSCVTPTPEAVPPKLENPVANRRSQASEETVEIFVEADFETHATVADLLSPAHVSWRKTLSFSILA